MRLDITIKTITAEVNIEETLTSHFNWLREGLQIGDWDSQFGGQWREKKYIICSCYIEPIKDR